MENGGNCLMRPISKTFKTITNNKTYLVRDSWGEGKFNLTYFINFRISSFLYSIISTQPMAMLNHPPSIWCVRIKLICENYLVIWFKWYKWDLFLSKIVALSWEITCREGPHLVSLNPDCWEHWHNQSTTQIWGASECTQIIFKYTEWAEL